MTLNPEDMPIIEGLDLSKCSKYEPLEDVHWIVDYKRMQKDLDLLTTCGIFDTKECISSEELCKLLKTKGE